MNAKPAPKLSELLFLTVIGHLAKVTYTTEVIFYWILRGSCHIQSVEISVEYWNFHQNLNLRFLLIFSWKRILRSNFEFWKTFKLLRCINSKEIQIQSSIRVVYTFLDLIFFSWKLKTLTTISIFNANFNTLNMTWSTHNFLWFSDKNLKFTTFEKIDSSY